MPELLRFYCARNRRQSLSIGFGLERIGAFEEATGENFFELAEGWDDGEGGGGKQPKPSHLIALGHAAFQEHHPDMTKQLAGKLLSMDLGLVQDLMKAAAKGVVDTSGAVEDTGKKTSPASQ